MILIFSSKSTWKLLVLVLLIIVVLGRFGNCVMADTVDNNAIAAELEWHSLFEPGAVDAFISDNKSLFTDKFVGCYYWLATSMEQLIREDRHGCGDNEFCLKQLHESVQRRKDMADALAGKRKYSDTVSGRAAIARRAEALAQRGGLPDPSAAAVRQMYHATEMLPRTCVE